MNYLNKLIADVKEFRTVFMLDTRRWITHNEQRLHDSLIIEELRELADAKTDVERLDAIVDSVYVLVGQIAHCDKRAKEVAYFIDVLARTAQSYGYDFLKAWDIVHASNMSKPCVSLKEARETKERYEFLGYEIEIIAVENYFIVCNESDVTLKCGKFVKAGKVLKSINYKEADLTSAISGVKK